MFRTLLKNLCMIGLFLAIGGPANATYHMFRIDELYSNANGAIQFIVLKAYSGGQQSIAGHTITSSQGGMTRSFTFPSNLPGDTATTMSTTDYYGHYITNTTYKSFLIGTQGFAALGVVTPDYVVPNGFLFTANGTLNYAESADIWSYASLATDGNLALNRDGQVTLNSAKNFAGATGTVVPTAADTVDYTGAWYDASESGWGLSVIRGASGLYGIVMYHYNQSSNPTWYFMSGGSFSGTTYSAPVTLFSGPSFTSPTFDSTTVTHNSVGTASINFTSATTATLTYTISGTPATKALNKLQF